MLNGAVVLCSEPHVTCKFYLYLRLTAWFGEQFLNCFHITQSPDITLTIHPHLEPMLRMSGGTALLPPHAFMAGAGLALPFPSRHIGFLVLYVFSDHIFNIRYHTHQIILAAMSAGYHVLNSNLYYNHMFCNWNRFCFHS